MVVWDTHLPNGCVGRQAFPMVALVLKLPNPRDGSSSKIIGLAELVQIRYKSRSRRECTVHSAFTVSGIHALLPVIRDWRLVTSGGANASAASWRRSGSLCSVSGTQWRVHHAGFLRYCLLDCPIYTCPSVQVGHLVGQHGSCVSQGLVPPGRLCSCIG